LRQHQQRGKLKIKSRKETERERDPVGFTSSLHYHCAVLGFERERKCMTARGFIVKNVLYYGWMTYLL